MPNTKLVATVKTEAGQTVQLTLADIFQAMGELTGAAQEQERHRLAGFLEALETQLQKVQDK